MCIRALSVKEENSTVSDWVQSGTWDLSRLAEMINKEGLQLLMARIPPMEGVGDDVMIWNETDNGLFSLKSAYLMIEKPPQQFYDSTFKKIWSWKGAEKIRVFIWKAYRDRLPINA